MMLRQQVFDQALLLAGELEGKQRELLRLLCSASASSLEKRLREGLKLEDCRADFIAAASLYALAALGSAREETSVEEFKAGDLTVRQSGSAKDAASRALEKQAEMLIRPYLADSFAFVGV